MDIIHLLPDSVANQIAAGEVIQRPASCLKELVENSLDAGAGRVQVIVRDAGRTLLQVIDDGCGMSETDARMAFERHATSKISQASDLFSLHTMGFRGEALASICAVAHVEVITRRAEYEIGTLIEIAGSKVIRQEACSCPIGTNFKVKDLFFNVPARRNFLKSNQTELRNLLNDFYRIILVYPKVQFTFVHNDEILIDVPSQNEKQRIESIFGKSSTHLYTEQLVDIQTNTEIISIHGFIGKPETATHTAQQYFFVNGRYMRHPYFHKAIMNAYTGMLNNDCAPAYFIYFDVPPESIDVNIHPTKTEIKFKDEQLIFQILSATIREGLGKFNITPSLDFNRSGEIEMPTNSTTSMPKAPQMLIATNYTPFKRQNVNKDWGQLYNNTPDIHTNKTNASGSYSNTNNVIENNIEQEALFGNEETDTQRVWQHDGKYIFMSMPDNLMIIDQHRAHTCILFNTYLQRIHSEQWASQQLLFPETIEISTEEILLLEAIQDELHNIGFEINRFSKNSYNITAIPSILEGQDAAGLIHDIIHSINESNTSMAAKWHQEIALALARKTAIPYGRQLSTTEMQDIVKQLMSMPNHTYTIDGKRITSIINNEDIHKRFK